MVLSLFSPPELRRLVGQRAKDLRLSLGRAQADVAAAAGVSRATLLRFEHTGDVGFDAVVRIALVLGAEREFANVFAPREARSIDDILRAERKPQRAGRKR